MLRAAPALAFSDADVPTDVIVAWADGGLAIDTTVGEVDVTVELRLVHGDDDLRWTEGPVRVVPDETALVAPVWPDLAAKGAQLVVPATVTGIVRVVTADGVDLEPRALPLGYASLGAHGAVVADGASLDALLPPELRATDGSAVASINPAVALELPPDAQVTP